VCKARPGFVTVAMLLAGISETRIAGHTGHRDRNVLRLYYRNGCTMGNASRPSKGQSNAPSDR
jgi:hypothetical protein